MIFFTTRWSVLPALEDQPFHTAVLTDIVHLRLLVNSLSLLSFFLYFSLSPFQIFQECKTKHSEPPCSPRPSSPQWSSQCESAQVGHGQYYSLLHQKFPTKERCSCIYFLPARNALTAWSGSPSRRWRRKWRTGLWWAPVVPVASWTISSILLPAPAMQGRLNIAKCSFWSGKCCIEQKNKFDLIVRISFGHRMVHKGTLPKDILDCCH